MFIDRDQILTRLDQIYKEADLFVSLCIPGMEKERAGFSGNFPKERKSFIMPLPACHGKKIFSFKGFMSPKVWFPPFLPLKNFLSFLKC